MVSYDLFLFRLKIETSSRRTNSMPFLVFRRDHLRSTSGIRALLSSSLHALQAYDEGAQFCGSGSFAVQFGDHFRSGDHIWCCTAPFMTLRIIFNCGFLVTALCAYWRVACMTDVQRGGRGGTRTAKRDLLPHGLTGENQKV